MDTICLLHPGAVLRWGWWRGRQLGGRPGGGYGHSRARTRPGTAGVKFRKYLLVRLSGLFFISPWWIMPNFKESHFPFLNSETCRFSRGHVYGRNSPWAWKFVVCFNALSSFWNKRFNLHTTILWAWQPQMWHDDSSIHSRKIKRKRLTHFVSRSGSLLLGLINPRLRLGHFMPNPFFNSWFIAPSHFFCQIYKLSCSLCNIYFAHEATRQ